MINFVEQPEFEVHLNSEATSRRMGLFSLVLLVVDVIVLLGIFSYGNFWKLKERSAREEMERLNYTLGTLGEQEKMVQRVNKRAQSVNEFLNSRGKVSDIAGYFISPDWKAIKWESETGGKQMVAIETDTLDKVKMFVDKATGLFRNVQLESVTWDDTTNLWTATLTMRGGV